MIKQASRTLLRQSPLRPIFRPTGRFASTAPPTQKPRSWKNTATRWGLAAGLVYYYNTATLFADKPAYSSSPSRNPIEDRSQFQSPPSSRYSPADTSTTNAPDSPLDSPLDPSLETDADEDTEHSTQQGAFNEETGEINWDCPCLGGMAYGPCGEQFRTAFSCFVFSTAETKGMDCIEHFKGMQDCFRAHPDIYGAEIEEEREEARLAEEAMAEAKGSGDDADAAAAEAEAEVKGDAAAKVQSSEAEPALQPRDTDHGGAASTANLVTETPSSSSVPPPSPITGGQVQAHTPVHVKAQMAVDDPGEPNAETEGILPRASHDATGDNK